LIDAPIPYVRNAGANSADFDEKPGVGHLTNRPGAQEVLKDNGGCCPDTHSLHIAPTFRKPENTIPSLILLVGFEFGGERGIRTPDTAFDRITV
jgi:hypothetical protein